MLERAGLELNDTVFMDRGRCSSYPGVVHQYSLAGSFADAAAAAATATATATAQCSQSSWHNGTAAVGIPLPFQLGAKSPAECCQIANTAPLSYYTSAWNSYSNGSCQLIYEKTGPVNNKRLKARAMLPTPPPPHTHTHTQTHTPPVALPRHLKLNTIDSGAPRTCRRCHRPL